MSVLSIEAIEQGLVDAGVPRSIARARALAEHGQSSVKSTEELERDDAREEKRIVADADKQLRALGFRAINTSQPRHAKFLTPGIPDRIYFHQLRGIALWWEAKTINGEQSPAQKDFQEDCEAAGWVYLLGTDQAVYDWLIAHGIAFEEGGLLVALPYTPAARTA